MDFLRDPQVMELAQTLRRRAQAGRYTVSDLLWREGNTEYQFVDLVMEGGGTLGIALVGYLYAMEQAKIRFLSVGGSSVGGIVALLLAGAGPHTEEKSARLAAILSAMDMNDFLDGNFFCRRLSRLLGRDEAPLRGPRLALLSLLSAPTLSRTLGLNPGNAFLSWLSAQLQELGVDSLQTLQRQIDLLPADLFHREQGLAFIRPAPALKLVAADITAGRKAVFPAMAPLYWADADAPHPALFGRATMSIPAFFQPVELRAMPQAARSASISGQAGAGGSALPPRTLLVDGGLLSNFPISLFHQERMPNAPTFGARLGSAAARAQSIDSLGSYCGALLRSLRRYNDEDFIEQNPDYRALISYIPTDGHHWLNFHMEKAEQLALFQEGMSAAADFLERFDWAGYKEIRRARLQEAAHAGK